MYQVPQPQNRHHIPRLIEALTHAAQGLSDEQLQSELRCAERCVMLSTRTRRDLWMARLRCIRCELERREAERAGTNPWLGR